MITSCMPALIMTDLFLFQHASLVHPRDPLQTIRISRQRMSKRLSILDPSADVEIHSSISREVVVRIVRLAGAPAPPLRLLRCLDPLRAGEYPAAGDPRVKEGAVVRAPVECGWRRTDPDTGEVGFEEVLDVV